MQTLVFAALLSVQAVSVETGSLMFLENSNWFVEKFTDSDITHVAMIVNRDGEPWIYEATPVKVRRVPLTRYYQELAELNKDRREKTRIRLLRPAEPYSAKQVAAIRNYLDSQLDRRYSVKGIVRGRPSDGIHCSEYAATALSKTDRFEFDKCHTISPSALMARADDGYLAPREIPIPRFKPKEPWCSRTWNRWMGYASWCKWSCWETWTFCR